MRLAVNARFLAAPTTGVQRVAREIVARLATRARLTLHVPADAPVPEELADLCEVRRGTLAGNAWEQLELPARAQGAAVLLNPANTAPLAGPAGVVILNDVLALTHPEWFAPLFVRWYRFMLPRIAARALRVITWSGWAAHEIARTLPVPSERIVVLPQGLEPFRAPATPEEIAAVRSRFGVEGPYLLATGDGDARKNTRFLEHVIDRWRSTRGDPPALVVVGRAPRRVFRRAHRNGFQSDTRWIGSISDTELRALYTGAEALCFPSLGEGFGRPPLEALACGTPAIAAPYEVASEILGDSTAIVPLEPEAWCRELEAVVGKPEERRARVAAARPWLQRYDWDATAEGVLEVCRSALTRE